MAERGPFEERLIELLGDHATVYSHTERGHRLVLVEWPDRYDGTPMRSPSFYADDGELGPYDGGLWRPCAVCRAEQPDGEPDACLGYVDGVWAACCGHGDVRQAYAARRDEGIVREHAALEWFAEHGVGPFVPPREREVSIRRTPHVEPGGSWITDPPVVRLEPDA